MASNGRTAQPKRGEELEQAKEPNLCLEAQAKFKKAPPGRSGPVIAFFQRMCETADDDCVYIAPTADSPHGTCKRDKAAKQRAQQALFQQQKQEAEEEEPRRNDGKKPEENDASKSEGTHHHVQKVLF